MSIKHFFKIKAAVLLACLCLGALAADKKQHSAPIQEAELLQALAKENGLDDKRAQFLMPQLRSELSMRLLLAKKAKEAGLDSNSQVAARQALANATVLSQAYLDYWQSKSPPSEQELKSDYAAMFPAKERVQVVMALYKTHEKAIASLSLLKSGAKKIEELSKESDDEELATRAGSFGWINLDALPVELAKILRLQGAISSEPSVSSEPVKIEYGYVVYEMRGYKVEPEKTFDEAISVLRDQRKQMMLRAELSRIKNEVEKK